MPHRHRILLSLLLAILATLFALHHLHALEERVVSTETGQVIVAARSVSKGTQLTADMLASISMAEEHIPANAITEVSQVLGRTTLTDLATGSLLLWEHINTGKTLAQRLPSATYALTLAVDERSSQAGLLRPGDYVDVIGVVTGNSLPGPTSIRVLQKVPVMAVQGSLDPGATSATSGRTTVTLGVSPEEAQLLALFEDYSSLRLVLCSELGPDDETSTDPVELREVLARWGLSFEKEAGSLGTEWTNLLQGIGWPRESSLESNLSTGLQGEIIRGTEVQIRNLN